MATRTELVERLARTKKCSKVGVFSFLGLFQSITVKALTHVQDQLKKQKITSAEHSWANWLCICPCSCVCVFSQEVHAVTCVSVLSALTHVRVQSQKSCCLVCLLPCTHPCLCLFCHRSHAV